LSCGKAALKAMPPGAVEAGGLIPFISRDGDVLYPCFCSSPYMAFALWRYPENAQFRYL
jgi:hypothetical protein